MPTRNEVMEVTSSFDRLPFYARSKSHPLMQPRKIKYASPNKRKLDEFKRICGKDALPCLPPL